MKRSEVFHCTTLAKAAKFLEKNQLELFVVLLHRLTGNLPLNCVINSTVKKDLREHKFCFIAERFALGNGFGELRDKENSNYRFFIVFKERSLAVVAEEAVNPI